MTKSWKFTVIIIVIIFMLNILFNQLQISNLKKRLDSFEVTLYSSSSSQLDDLSSDVTVEKDGLQRIEKEVELIKDSLQTRSAMEEDILSIYSKIDNIEKVLIEQKKLLIAQKYGTKDLQVKWLLSQEVKELNSAELESFSLSIYSLFEIDSLEYLEVLKDLEIDKGLEYCLLYIGGIIQNGTEEEVELIRNNLTEKLLDSNNSSNETKLINYSIDILEDN